MSFDTFKISHPHGVFLYLYSPQSMRQIKKRNANRKFASTEFHWPLTSSRLTASATSSAALQDIFCEVFSNLAMKSVTATLFLKQDAKVARKFDYLHMLKRVG
ncbi:hypothetical protein [Dryocola sp. BD613]|uniref:hypothetical protein n=1 Tax=Dryocola sp. BD613 TaxID=3133272 RepID=UPI003F506D98